MLKTIHVNNCVTIRREENPEFNPTGLIQDVTHPNPEFYKNVRLGFSNYGVQHNICLAEIYPDKLLLPRGLVSEILKKYPSVTVIDETIIKPVVFKPSRTILKDYQQDTLTSLLKKNQGILESPSGSGKTVIYIELIILRDQKTLILVHTIDLLHQWRERFRQFTDIEPGIVQGDSFEVRDVTIATVQSLKQPLDDTFTGQFGMVILDECHHCPASTFQHLVDRFPARFRYGATATPERQDGLRFVMTAVMGPIVHAVENAVLLGNRSILRPKIKVVQTNIYFSTVENYQELLAKIVKNECRNNLIVDLISQESQAGHFCLVLSERVGHVQELHRLFSEQNPSIKAYCITGNDLKETRQQAIEAMNTGASKVLFSTKLADEGLDIRRLDRLFLTCPVRAVSKIQQQTGRIQRTFPGKRDAVVYDFVDMNSLAESQFNTRRRYVYHDYEIEHVKEAQYDATNSNNTKTA